MSAALFAKPPVEWNRLPQFQDVTIRLIAQRGVLHDRSGLLQLFAERAPNELVDLINQPEDLGEWFQSYFWKSAFQI